MSRVYPPHWTLKPVQEISGTDIGRLMRYYAWDAQREVATVVTGELRQISHNQAETTLVFGIGAEQEWTFQNGEAVILDPAPDYSDVRDVRQAYQDFHALDGQETH